MRKKLAIIWNRTDSAPCLGWLCRRARRAAAVGAHLPHSTARGASGRHRPGSPPTPKPLQPPNSSARHLPHAAASLYLPGPRLHPTRAPPAWRHRPSNAPVRGPVRAARDSASQIPCSDRHTRAPTPLPRLVHICGDSAVPGTAPTAAVVTQAQRQPCALVCL